MTNPLTASVPVQRTGVNLMPRRSFPSAAEVIREALIEMDELHLDDIALEVEFDEMVEDGDPTPDTLEPAKEKGTDVPVSTDDAPQHRWFGGLEDDDHDVC